jgi:hypothetical protein
LGAGFFDLLMAAKGKSRVVHGFQERHVCSPVILTSRSKWKRNPVPVLISLPCGERGPEVENASHSAYRTFQDPADCGRQFAPAVRFHFQLCLAAVRSIPCAALVFGRLVNFVN